MNKNNLQDWLAEQDFTSAPDSPVGPPTSQPDFADEMVEKEKDAVDPNAPIEDQLAKNLNNDESDPEEDPESGVEDNEIEEPEFPDFPEEEKDLEDDFDSWKKNYFRESVNGTPGKLLDLLYPMRNREDLEPYQRKFIEDNINIQLIRINANVEKASKSIRKSIKQQLDKNNPSTSLVTHINTILDASSDVSNIFIKMTGYSGYKGELHRKFIGALLGAVQVSSSPDKENLILNDKEYSIKISTRLNSEWGDVSLGSWSLKEDDPEKYLSEPELARLTEGSPEERDILRKRIIIESISKQFEEQSFIINVIDEDGTIVYLGCDLANALRGAYSDGKLIVKNDKSLDSEAVIDENGTIIAMSDLKINFVKETGEFDSEGQPVLEELSFIQKKKGMLFLTASHSTINDAAYVMQGTVIKETPYKGNPSDLKDIRSCIYSCHDLLMRQC